MKCSYNSTDMQLLIMCLELWDEHSGRGLWNNPSKQELASLHWEQAPEIPTVKLLRFNWGHTKEICHPQRKLACYSHVNSTSLIMDDLWGGNNVVPYLAHLRWIAPWDQWVHPSMSGLAFPTKAAYLGADFTGHSLRAERCRQAGRPMCN